MRPCWLAFASAASQHSASMQMRGLKFPGSFSKLWAEFREERQRKGLSEYNREIPLPRLAASSSVLSGVYVLPYSGCLRLVLGYVFCHLELC